MQSLTTGLYAEDFFYGYPYDQVVPPLPTQFDYEGVALTNAGLLTCPPGTFVLEYGRDVTLNPDASLPYGGSPDANDYYLRFPVLSWSGTAGLFLHVTTTDTATLTFDRSWSGYVGDTFSVVVDGVEAMTVTGSAGYPWVRSSVQLGPGSHDITFVLNCAPFSAGTIRQGQAQSSAVVDLFRFLRITNLSISNVATLPVADNQKLAMVASASWTQKAPLLKVTTGTLTLSAVTDLLWPKKLSGPISLTPTSSLSTGAGSFVGKYGRASLGAEVQLSLVCAVENDVQPEQAGFGIDATAALEIESTLTPPTSSYARPLMYSQLEMSRPVFVNGRPVSPIALSETEIEYAVEATVLSKINPVDPTNQLPVTPTLRWLSLGAHYDPPTEQLMTWYDTTGTGATWTPGAPGAYAPTVDDFQIKNPGGITTVRYPSVHFDATHGDHLTATLPPANPGVTFVIVGSFTRYRGQLNDSCPILDYAGARPLAGDYAAPGSPQRGIFPWADPASAASLYLGLVPANKQEPTVSKIAFATASGYQTTDDVVISDNTPMVLIFSSSASGSFLWATPLITGQNAATSRMVSALPGSAPTAGQRTFTLGKARRTPPLNGLFSTGTMSLLEVAYFNRAITGDEASRISEFLVGLYSPVDIAAGPTLTTLGTGNIDSEQLLIYAANPEQPIALISGDRTTVTDWYVSDPTGLGYATSFTQAGVPLIQVSNRDYTNIVDAGTPS